MKNYISSQEELAKIPVNNRDKYYLDDRLVAKSLGFVQNDEKMVEIKSDEMSFLVEPFWKDKLFEVGDLELQKLLDSEGEAFRRYIKSHPDFSMQVRKTVLDKLVEVQQKLPDNLKLVIKAGYRPLQVQRELFNESLEFLKDKFPDKTEKELYEMNLEFVADADNFIPPHSTGAAVDLYIFNTETNKPLDMGSPINYPDDKSWTYNFKDLTDIQIQNRLFLTKFMIEKGFANLASEWWHYSYGDQYWAMFYNKGNCLYNSIQEI